MTYPLGRYRAGWWIPLFSGPLGLLTEATSTLYLFGRGTQVCSPRVCTSGPNTVFTMLNQEKEKTNRILSPVSRVR